jgi:sulfur-carrier protein
VADVAVKVTVRYFAAARAAAGLDDEIIGIAPDTSLGVLVRSLGERNPELAKVLSRCSYLCDGIAVRDLGMTLKDVETIDVLPPFAGG